MGADDFDTIDDILNLATKPAAAEPPAPPAPSPQQTAQPVVPPVQPPAPAPAAPPVAAQPEAQPPAPAPAAPQATADQPATPEAVIQALQTQEAELLKNLVPQFAMSPELVAEMQEDAVAATPKLLANVYMKAVATNLQYMQQMVPAMVQRGVQQILAARDAESAFFKQFPQLNESHAQDIRTFGMQFRQANPQITREELWKQIGAAVMAFRGISAVPSPAPGPAPARPVPFQPAANGGVVVQNQPVASPSGFSGMGGEYDD